MTGPTATDWKVIEEDVKILKELRAEKELLEKKISKIEDEVKDIMDRTKTYIFEGEDWKVTWNMVASNRFNQKLFGENHPDLLEKYKTISESRRFILQ